MSARTLIISVHPMKDSFTAQWAAASAEAARRSGSARLIDLHAEGFDPIEHPRHYAEPGPDVMRMQDAAARSGALPVEVADHVAAIRAAERIIFHFPLWWFAPPAMLKGWTERVLVHGAMHSSRARFDTGPCRGKRALFCVTTGSSAAESGPDGKEGDTRLHLFALAYTLRYCGFDVAEPVIVHGVHGFHEGAARERLEARLRAVLERQAEIVAGLDERPLLTFNADSDFEEGRLRADAPSHWPFIARE
ncbi:NAD(P)H-dependent oxidoreductase [Roseobacter sp. HKCCA0434]|uniref:NAD(P)H-dependent oxidoreductase n=1 Tax=Roseobacter sp. HKCCA0434 TaxID=3079297 RepID=UPI0029058789|nr:NAD(P)H-dependent oxidoreductase [Roseobacter sp. HKCCA0434]